MAAKISRGLHGVARGRPHSRPRSPTATAAPNRFDERGAGHPRPAGNSPPNRRRSCAAYSSSTPPDSAGPSSPSCSTATASPHPADPRGHTPRIVGHPDRRKGLLHNDLYRGLLVLRRPAARPQPRHRQAPSPHRPPSPSTPCRKCRTCASSTDDLWAAAHAQHRRAKANLPAHFGSRGTPLPLTPVLRCASCGGPNARVPHRTVQLRDPPPAPDLRHETRRRRRHPRIPDRRRPCATGQENTPAAAAWSRPPSSTAYSAARRSKPAFATPSSG